MDRRADMMRKSTNNRALKVRKELELLKGRKDPRVEFKSGGGEVDGFWLLGQPQAPQVCLQMLLTNLWYEAIHLDAASYDLIPVIKTLPNDQLTSEEKGLLLRKRRDPLRLPVKVVSTIGSPPLDLMEHGGVEPDDTDLVILTSHPASGTRGFHRVFVYFKECDDLKVRDKPFIRRFYTLAQPRENVYRISQEKAEVLMALDELGRP